MSSGRGLSFVSEADLEEKRQKRQEEWEKVRQPDEPLGTVHTCRFSPRKTNAFA